MQSIKMFRKFLIPCSAAAVVVAKDKDDGVLDTKLIRPSDLPVYCDDDASDGRVSNSSNEISKLESVIGSCRKELWVWYDYYKGYEQRVVDFWQTGMAHSKSTLDFLREEENILPRSGAIALGSVAGYIFAVRGGKFKKLIYTAAGGVTLAALCYPREAAEITEEAFYMGKKYSVITYNFIYGVTPETLRKPLPSPEVETSSKISSPNASTAKDNKSSSVTADEPLPNKADNLKSPGAGADQSNPVDKDLYTTRNKHR